MTSGKLLGIRGWEAEPTDTLFFSSMRKGSLPPEFASLEETSLDHWKGAAALDAAAVLATGGGAMCAALGTFNNELVPAPKTSFAASMCTRVVFKNWLDRRVAAQRIITIAASCRPKIEAWRLVKNAATTALLK